MEDWRKAGEIASRVLEFGRKAIKPGRSFLEVADEIEDKIVELGGKTAFPVNLSYDEIASHFIPGRNDKLIFEEQVINLDVGVQVNGAIGDTACAVDLSGKYKDLVKSVEEALKNVEKLLSSDPSLSEIGRTVQGTIEGFGYKPIANLSGHTLGMYEVHAGISIPNVDTGDEAQLPLDTPVAIEPFATMGRGLIKSSSRPEIFQQVKQGNVRSPMGRSVLKEIGDFEGLPFAKRWLQTKGVEFGIKELERAQILKAYPPLVDVDNKVTVQAEHTFILTEDGYEKLTKH